MGFWSRNLDPTIANDTEHFAFGPSGGRLKMWLAGAGIAGLIVGFGIMGLVTGKTILLSRQTILTVTDNAAVALSTAYVAIGLFLHFHYFWGLHNHLWRYSQALKMVSLVVFIPCFIYGMAEAVNLFTWLQ